MPYRPNLNLPHFRQASRGAGGRAAASILLLLAGLLCLTGCREEPALPSQKIEWVADLGWVYPFACQNNYELIPDGKGGVALAGQFMLPRAFQSYPFFAPDKVLVNFIRLDSRGKIVRQVPLQETSLYRVNKLLPWQKGTFLLRLDPMSGVDSREKVLQLSPRGKVLQTAVLPDLNRMLPVLLPQEKKRPEIKTAAKPAPPQIPGWQRLAPRPGFAWQEIFPLPEGGWLIGWKMESEKRQTFRLETLDRQGKSRGSRIIPLPGAFQRSRWLPDPKGGAVIAGNFVADPAWEQANQLAGGMLVRVDEKGAVRCQKLPQGFLVDRLWPAGEDGFLVSGWEYVPAPGKTVDKLKSACQARLLDFLFFCGHDSPPYELADLIRGICAVEPSSFALTRLKLLKIKY